MATEKLKTKEKMIGLIKMMVKDYQKEGFTAREWKIGTAITAGLVFIAILANF